MGWGGCAWVYAFGDSCGLGAVRGSDSSQTDVVPGFSHSASAATEREAWVDEQGLVSRGATIVLFHADLT